MEPEIKPLFTLTIAEFMALTKKLVEESINEKMQSNNSQKLDEVPERSELSISELTRFLHCSKASVHNYKKLGMPFYRIGRKILFRKNEVLDFMRGLKNKIKRH